MKKNENINEGFKWPEFEKFSKDGNLGFYERFEIINIFRVDKHSNDITNVLSVCIAEPKFEASSSEEMLNPERINIKADKNGCYGIKRFEVTMDKMQDSILHYSKTGEWRFGEDPIQVGDLQRSIPQFVPSDCSIPVPLNHILKNNFWNGSYVLDLFDPTKGNLQHFINTPQSLQELSNEIQKYVPISLASLSDRLGNIIFQFPIEVITSSAFKNREAGDYEIEIAWHPEASPRKLYGMHKTEFDGAIIGACINELTPGVNSLYRDPKLSTYEYFIWDSENELILGGHQSVSLIRSINMDMMPISPEPRIFKMPDGTQRRIQIRSTEMSSLDNKTSIDTLDYESTAKRIYDEEQAKLARERVFIQYKPDKRPSDEVHEEALNDLRSLISSYGREAVWIWDPYLSPDDILKTLFFCPFHGSDLRAITNFKDGSASKTRDNYRQKFKAFDSKYYGMRLEFCGNINAHGWNFHDRFLIFPSKLDKPHAWSLGISVNQYGKEHHILQKVDNARLIADSFEELWNKLEHEECLVGKIPNG